MHPKRLLGWSIVMIVPLVHLICEAFGIKLPLAFTWNGLVAQTIPLLGLGLAIPWSQRTLTTRGRQTVSQLAACLFVVVGTLTLLGADQHGFRQAGYVIMDVMTLLLATWALIRVYRDKETFQ